MRTLLFVSLLAASTVYAAPKAPAKKAVKAVIEIKALTINFDGNPIARLKADGTTESVGDNKPGPNAIFTPGPTLHADGTIDLKAGYKIVIDKGEILVVAPDPKLPQQVFGTFDGAKILVGEKGSAGTLRMDGPKVIDEVNGKVTVLGYVDPVKMGPTAVIMAAALYIEMGINPPSK